MTIYLPVIEYKGERRAIGRSSPIWDASEVEHRSCDIIGGGHVILTIAKYQTLPVVAFIEQESE